MRFNKTWTALSVIAIILAFTVFLSTCRSKKIMVIPSHYIDTNDTRSVQVQKCGECHTSEFENWKLDGHSNAYLTLEDHDRMLDSSGNFPEGYNEYVEASLEKICAACHTGQNIYETNFKGISHRMSPHMLVKDSFPEAFMQAYSRNVHERDNILNGVDCITCHVQGTRVVTNITSKAPDSLGIIKSHLFSSNQSCYSCHHHQVSTMQELVTRKIIPYEVSCVNCHQEYDSKGKGTHYYYWRNDAPGKNRPERLNIFECVKITFPEHDPDKNVIFNWTNTVMPHGFSECGEAKCNVVAVYSGGSEKIVLSEYLNRKNFFDTQKNMATHFNIGRNGNEFIFNQPIIRNLLIDNFSQLDHIRVEGWAKPQYWSTEKEFKLVYERNVPVIF